MPNGNILVYLRIDGIDEAAINFFKANSSFPQLRHLCLQTDTSTHSRVVVALSAPGRLPSLRKLEWGTSMEGDSFSFDRGKFVTFLALGKISKEAKKLKKISVFNLTPYSLIDANNLSALLRHLRTHFPTVPLRGFSIQERSLWELMPSDLVGPQEFNMFLPATEAVGQHAVDDCALDLLWRKLKSITIERDFEYFSWTFKRSAEIFSRSSLLSSVKEGNLKSIKNRLIVFCVFANAIYAGRPSSKSASDLFDEIFNFLKSQLFEGPLTALFDELAGLLPVFSNNVQFLVGFFWSLDDETWKQHGVVAAVFNRYQHLDKAVTKPEMLLRLMAHDDFNAHLFFSTQSKCLTKLLARMWNPDANDAEEARNEGRGVWIRTMEKMLEVHPDGISILWMYGVVRPGTLLSVLGDPQSAELFGLLFCDCAAFMDSVASALPDWSWDPLSLVQLQNLRLLLAKHCEKYGDDFDAVTQGVDNIVWSPSVYKKSPEMFRKIVEDIFQVFPESPLPQLFVITATEEQQEAISDMLSPPTLV